MKKKNCANNQQTKQTNKQTSSRSPHSLPPSVRSHTACSGERTTQSPTTTPPCCCRWWRGRGWGLEPRTRRRRRRRRRRRAKMKTTAKKGSLESERDSGCSRAGRQHVHSTASGGSPNEFACERRRRRRRRRRRTSWSLSQGPVGSGKAHAPAVASPSRLSPGPSRTWAASCSAGCSRRACVCAGR